MHQNLGPSFLGCETQRSPQHRRPFSHTLNPQAVRGDSHGFSVKATSIVDYCYLQSCGQTGEPNADRLSSGMPGYVGQGFLENAIQRDLNCWWQVAGVKFIQFEIYSDVVSLFVLGNVSGQRDTQAVVVQHRWVKSAGEPADFVDGLGSNSPQAMSLELDL